MSAPIIRFGVGLLGWFVILLILSEQLGFCADDEPIVQFPQWNFEKLTLKNGHELRGLLLEETPSYVRFQIVKRHPGRPTVVFSSFFPKSEFEKVDKLPTDQHDLLKQRLEELDPRGNGEKLRMEKIDIELMDWKGKKDAGFRYDSDYFQLQANAPEELVRRSAVRLEQVYAAYARFFPPRSSQGKPTAILLIESQEEYYQLLKAEGKNFLNPAFFDPAQNRIVICISDLKRLSQDLEKFRKDCQKLSKELTKQESELRKLYSKSPMDLARHLHPIRQMRSKISEASSRNDQLFYRTTQGHFQMLYHESFHAYIASFVFPPPKSQSEKATAELPRWLNEGLAQIFETALIESGELRVGHADPTRLQKVKAALKANQLTPIKQLITSDAKQFIVLHRGDRPGSDAAYLTSWGLGMYLLFERKLIVSANFQEYLEALRTQRNPVEAFEKLTGQSLEAFEQDFHTYLHRLQNDGSALPLIVKP